MVDLDPWGVSRTAEGAIGAASGFGAGAMAPGVGRPGSMSPMVWQDRRRLGDLTGFDVIHLQCDVGTWTLDLARLGARRVVGVDDSEEAVRWAGQTSLREGVEVEFVHSDVLDVRRAVTGRFDMVYSSVGSLARHRDLDQWARVVASLLAPGGRIFIRDDHPVRQTLADDVASGLTITRPYFDGPALLEGLADDDQILGSEGLFREWTHSLGRVVTALTRAHMVIDELEEFDVMSWNAWPGVMVPVDEGFAFARGRSRVPLEYVLQAHLDDVPAADNSRWESRESALGFPWSVISGGGA